MIVATTDPEADPAPDAGGAVADVGKLRSYVPKILLISISGAIFYDQYGTIRFISTDTTPMYHNATNTYKSL